MPFKICAVFWNPTFDGREDFKDGFLRVFVEALDRSIDRLSFAIASSFERLTQSPCFRH